MSFSEKAKYVRELIAKGETKEAKEILNGSMYSRHEEITDEKVKEHVALIYRTNMKLVEEKSIADVWKNDKAYSDSLAKMPPPILKEDEE